MNAARDRHTVRFDVEADAKQDLSGRFAVVSADTAKSEIHPAITTADPARAHAVGVFRPHVDPSLVQMDALFASVEHLASRSQL